MIEKKESSKGLLGRSRLWIGLLALTVNICIIFFVFQAFWRNGPAADQVAEDLEPVKKEMLPEDSNPLDNLLAFYEAPDAVSKAKFVRDGVRVVELMEDFHGRRKHPFPFLSNVTEGKELHFGSTMAVLFQVKPFTGDPYPLAMVWDGVSYKVDWESLTAYGTMDWGLFLNDKPTETQIMRVFLRASKVSPSAQGKTVGESYFIVEHRDHAQPVVAVCLNDLGYELAELVEGKRVPLILELAWKAGRDGGEPVVEILSIFRKTWEY